MEETHQKSFRHHSVLTSGDKTETDQELTNKPLNISAKPSSGSMSDLLEPVSQTKKYDRQGKLIVASTAPVNQASKLKNQMQSKSTEAVNIK